MRILVTGANGYIGSHVVRLLLDKGHSVVACDIRTDTIDSRAEIAEYNIFQDCSDKNLFHFFGEPDVCVHFAWRDGFVHNSDKHIADLSAHYQFLSNLMANGTKRIAVMGTMHEVGYHQGAIDENTPCRPQSLYGISKNALRDSLSFASQKFGCKLQWLRGFYIYGDDFKNHSIFTKLLEAEARGDKTFPFTSGKNKYDFMQVNELAGQISAVVVQDKITGIINCCTGNPISLSEAVEGFIKEHNMKIKLDYGAYPDRPYDSPCIYGDNTKIQQILNNRQ